MAAVGDHRTGPRRVHPDVLSARGSAWGSGHGGEPSYCSPNVCKGRQGSASRGRSGLHLRPVILWLTCPLAATRRLRASASSCDGRRSQRFALNPHVHRATVCSCRTREDGHGVKSGGGTPSTSRPVGPVFPLHLYSQLSGLTALACLHLNPQSLCGWSPTSRGRQGRDGDAHPGRDRR